MKKSDRDFLAMVDIGPIMARSQKAAAALENLESAAHEAADALDALRRDGWPIQRQPFEDLFRPAD